MIRESKTAFRSVCLYRAREYFRVLLAAQIQRVEKEASRLDNMSETWKLARQCIRGAQKSRTTTTRRVGPSVLVQASRQG